VPFILVNATHAPQRQRFSLAHELGHFWLRHGNTYDIRLSWSDTSREEVQANYFAASFLMPAPAVSEVLTALGHPDIDFDMLIRLATTFGVSAKAMRLRLEVLDHIRGKRIREFDDLIDAQAHHGLPDALGIAPVTDSLSAARGVGRMPSQMTAKALRAVERELLRDEHLPTLLRTEPHRIAEIRQQFDVVAE
jgi:Zn-dependent peptidase ImmA (M78 family)